MNATVGAPSSETTIKADEKVVVPVDPNLTAGSEPPKPKKVFVKITVEYEKMRALLEAKDRFAEYRTNHWQGLMVKATKEFLAAITKMEDAQ